jgi:hypothetical protein
LCDHVAGVRGSSRALGGGSNSLFRYKLRREQVRVNRFGVPTCCCGSVLITLVFGGLVGRASAQAPAPTEDPVKVLVGRLDLEKYKATIKALTQFGDRLHC